MASTYYKKKKRARRRKDEDGDPEFQVAPMVDVLLVLLLFFMSITSTEILKNDKNLHLADAQNGVQEKDRVNQITVNVSWDYANQVPGYSANGKPYASSAELVEFMADKAKGNPNAYAVIRADRGVQYSFISDMMSKCAKAGLAKVSFATLTGGERRIDPREQAQAPQ